MFFISCKVAIKKLKPVQLVLHFFRFLLVTLKIRKKASDAFL